MPGESSRQILVTGATGFIGRALVRALVGRGEQVIAASRKPNPLGTDSSVVEWRQCDLLNAGSVLDAMVTVELRASMVIGNGSTSWQIVRDLGMRLPVMILPRWLKSRTRPVAIDDVVTALLAAATIALEASAWFDIPGPEVMTGREILERIGALRGRQIIAIEIPLLTKRPGGRSRLRSNTRKTRVCAEPFCRKASMFIAELDPSLSGLGHVPSDRHQTCPQTLSGIFHRNRSSH